MEELKSKLNNLKDHGREYVQSYVDLAKVKATRTASVAVSSIVIGVIAFFFCFFFLFFVGFGLAWWVGTLLDNMAAGFFIIAGFFLLLTLVLFAIRKKVIVPMIRNLVIRKVYE